KPAGPRLLKPFFTSQDDDAFEDALSDRVRLHTEPKARAEREKELAEAVKREEEERKKSSAPVVPSASDLTITFSGNSSKIEPEQEQKLEAAAHQLSEMEGTRLQVRAYATG